MSFPQGATGAASPPGREDGPADHDGLPARLAADIRLFLVAGDGSFKHDAIETMLAYLLKLKREVAKGGSAHDSAASAVGKAPFNFNGTAPTAPAAVGHHAEAAHLAGGRPNYANIPTHVLRALAASMDGRARSGPYGPPPPPPPLGLLPPHEAGLHHHAHREEALRQAAENDARGAFAARLAAMGKASVGTSDGRPYEAHYDERGAREVCGEKRRGGIATDPEDSANSKRMKFESYLDSRSPVGVVPTIGFLGNPSVAPGFPPNRSANWTYDQWANRAALPIRRNEIAGEAGHNMTTLGADAVAEERANRMALMINKGSYSGDPRGGAFGSILASAAAIDSSSTGGAVVNGGNGIASDLEQRWFSRKIAGNGVHANDTVTPISKGKVNSKSSAENIESKAQKQNQKPASRKASRQSQQDAFDPVKNRPLNRFNLFFILERERLLMEMNDQGDTPAEKETKKTSDLPPGIATGYEGLEMPELPPRFKDLTLRELILFIRVHFISLSDVSLHTFDFTPAK